MQLSATSDTLPLIDVDGLIETRVAAQISRVEGVAQVNIGGLASAHGLKGAQILYQIVDHADQWQTKMSAQTFRAGNSDRVFHHPLCQSIHARQNFPFAGKKTS